MIEETKHDEQETGDEDRIPAPVPPSSNQPTWLKSWQYQFPKIAPDPKVVHQEDLADGK